MGISEGGGFQLEPLLNREKAQIPFGMLLWLPPFLRLSLFLDFFLVLSHFFVE